MKKRIFAAALAVALPLCGCAAVLERSYEAVTPHTSQYWEDASASALRFEDYQSLVNGLLLLVGERTDTALVRLYGYGDQASAIADMDRACAEVSMEDALGAYLVDYITYDCTERTNCYEMAVRFTYQRTSVQLNAMVNATADSALSSLLATALKTDASELAVKVDHRSRPVEEIEAELSGVMEAAGFAREDWTVSYFPDTGEAGGRCIVEICWGTQTAES